LAGFVGRDQAFEETEIDVDGDLAVGDVDWARDGVLMRPILAMREKARVSTLQLRCC
jgi:hypothetical protein